MIDGIKAAGITRANFFCYNHPDFGARNAISGGTYRLLWNTLVESQSSGDITPPTVSITSPTAGSNVSGSVNIAASATDNVGVTRVDFFIDGIIVSSNSISPYTVSWDSKTVGNGSHSITTKAYDSAGNVGTSTPVSVNVQNGDTILPTVSITAPTNGSTVSGGVNVTANASDNVGVTKVEFYVDSVLKVTDTTSPYGFGWDTPPVLNGAHSISAKAYDAVGNTASDSVTVTVQNGDTQAPTVPTGLAITTPAYNKVNLTWTASTDNVGVAGYWVIRNGVTIASTANNSYSDTTVQPNTNYTYQIVAYDAAGNYSAPTNPISVTTPSAPDDTPPSAPTNLVASVVSSSQINLSWTASKDNIGVIGYDVYRNSTKITTVTTTSFGDTGLSASTTYSYFVKARNAAGNVSAASNTASAATQAPPSTTGNITGTVYSSAGGVVGGAKISLTVGGSRKTYVTTSLGVYTISNLTTGTYKLSFSARGYTSQSASVTVAANTTVTKNITLVKSHKGKK
jgi:chitodextrinase